jgi:hypothetical protein
MSNLGFILYGIFTFACVTVLINTLIAMLEVTNWDIDNSADIEWKYARSKLYMEYIRNGKNNFFICLKSIESFPYFCTFRKQFTRSDEYLPITYIDYEFF